MPDMERCILPDYLVEDSISRVLRHQRAVAPETDAVTIGGRKRNLPWSSKTPLLVYMDWSQVVYFDDVALLQLILVQHRLLKSGVMITHFAGATAGKGKTLGEGQPIDCRPHVLRQLGAVGYFRQWIREDFGASRDEVRRLTTVNPLGGLGPLDRQREVLPIIACHSAEGLKRGSPEDLAIRRHEDDAATGAFIDQRGQTRERRLIASGEFAELVIRQCRKNVLEHARDKCLALSMARIVTRRDIAEEWDIPYDQWRRQADTPLARILDGVPEDMPLVDMTTADDGCGIPESLRPTWERQRMNSMKREGAYDRVRKRIGDQFDVWPEEAAVMEFALDEEGSSKPPDTRSKEEPGLCRIREIVARDQGLVQVTCGRYRVRHVGNSAPARIEQQGVFEKGTTVRVVIPLHETSISSGPRRLRKTSAGVLVGGKFIDPQGGERAVRWHMVSLRDLWLRGARSGTPGGPLPESEAERPAEPREAAAPLTETPGSLQPRIQALVTEIRRDVEKAKADKASHARVATLDWSELPWDEHHASCFLEELYETLSGGERFALPIVHINVPSGLRLASRKAVDRYNDLPLPTLVVPEEGDRQVWLGLWPRKPRLLMELARNWTSEGENLDVAYLRAAFGHLLRGAGDGSIPTFRLGAQAWHLAREYLDQTDLFEEVPTRSPVDGTPSRSGRYRPIVPLDDLRSAVTSTFISELKGALESNSCVFSPGSRTAKKSSGKARQELIQLPNGRLVSRYYRCDGLLNYEPTGPGEGRKAGEAGPQVRFRESLAAHLIDIAKELEEAGGRFDVVVSCTSPTHWFVHQLADGLSDSHHQCGHFVGKQVGTFGHEFKRFRVKKGAKALIFTDVVSTGTLVETMASALRRSDVEVGGLIALVDTRVSQTDPLGKVERDKQVFLVHSPVEKREGGKAQWRIDPETLEPIKAGDDHGWPETLAGVGDLAMPGKDVFDWFVGFGAVRHKHYRHGNRHSQFVCDVKRLFQRPEVQTRVGGGLNFYIREHGIDLIVYPNYSNAYLMTQMAREVSGSEGQPPPTQIALCRFIHGELSYVLTPRIRTEHAQNILILDDGLVTGGTMRSLIAAVLAQHRKAKQVHVVVFLNETSAAQTRYWATLGSKSYPARAGKPERKKGFLLPKFHFSSFMSFPHPSYTEEDCPLCRRQREFEYHARDEGRSGYEREFFRSWARDLQAKDIYHDPEERVSVAFVDARVSTHRNTKRTRGALEIAEFESRLQRGVPWAELVGRACEGDMPTHVRIHCLRSLLHLRESSLTQVQSTIVWRRLLRIVKDPDESARNRLLAMKAFIWEQSVDPTFTEFTSLLDAVASHLGDPLVLGAIMGYARLAFPPGHERPQWDQGALSDAMENLRGRTPDSRAQFGIRELHDWLSGSRAGGLGPSVVLLKRALQATPGHGHARGALKTLSDLFRNVKKTPNADVELQGAIRSAAHTVVDHLLRIERAATIVASYGPTEQAPLEAPQPTALRRLLDDGPSAGAQAIHKLAYDASAELKRLKGFWFSPDRGWILRLLSSHFHPLAPAIRNAGEEVEREYGPQYAGYQVHHDYSAFASAEGPRVEVLCRPADLSDALKNIVSNVWKHAVPESMSGERRTHQVVWKYRILEGHVTLVAHSSGSKLPPDKDFFPQGRGHARAKGNLKEFGAEYDVRSHESGGVEVKIKLICRR